MNTCEVPASMSRIDESEPENETMQFTVFIGDNEETYYFKASNRELFFKQLEEKTRHIKYLYIPEIKENIFDV